MQRTLRWADREAGGGVKTSRVADSADGDGERGIDDISIDRRRKIKSINSFFALNEKKTNENG